MGNERNQWFCFLNTHTPIFFHFLFYIKYVICYFKYRLFYFNYYGARRLKWKKPDLWKNQLFFQFNYWGSSAIEKNRGCIFSIIIFSIINYFRILEGGARDTFPNIFPVQWAKSRQNRGCSSHYFFSITINYNYFRILGLGDKEPTFFFVPTTINYCHAAVNERNRQESLFFLN